MKRFQVILQAATPISHGDTVTVIHNQTNPRRFMRQQMRVNGISARVPAVSENSLRSTIWREPLADSLVQSLGIKSEELPQSVMNLLYAGGNLGAGAKAPAQEQALGKQVRDLYPTLDLLGGSVDSFILPRSALRVAAWLVADEYAGILQHISPELADEARGVSACDLRGEETITRGTGSHASGNQMLYTYETLAAGSKILIEVTIDSNVSDATIAAAAHAFDCWDGYIGGQGRQGRGRMNVLSHNIPSSDAYLEHVKSYGEAMKNGLIDGTLGTGVELCKA